MRPAASVVAMLLVFGGCDELGNPSMTTLRTPAREWEAPGVRLRTTMRATVPERLDSLLAELAERRIHHLDAAVPRRGVVALVIVEPTYLRAPWGQNVRLETAIRLRSGATIRRRWRAPAEASRYYAVFGLPDWPEEALTALE